MRRFILLLLAVSLLLLLFIPLSVQAGETPPGYHNLRVEEQYDDHPWSEDESIENPNTPPLSLDNFSENEITAIISNESVSRVCEKYELSLFDSIILNLLNIVIIR